MNTIADSTTKSFLLKRDFQDPRDAEIAFPIDSGATYSLVPSSILRSLGLEPYSEVSIQLSDGHMLRRKVGGAYSEYHGEGGVVPVLFGEEGEEPLLGVVTLKALRLVLNPFKRELFPQRVIRM